MVYQVMYSSAATENMKLCDLKELLVVARKKNESLNITGFLVYVDGVFIQVLEGNQEDVLGLMNTIESDRRHESVKIFFQATETSRMFTDWRMAHVDVSLEQIADWYELEGVVSTDLILKDIEDNPSTLREHVKGILMAIS